MPSHQDMNAARLRGAIARNSADEHLLDPDQRAQNQAEAAAPLPRENNAAVARLFSTAFQADVQPPPAVQPAPTINSRTGQHPSTATNQQQRRVITTDAHGRAAAPSRQRNSRGRSGNQRRTQTARRPPTGARRRPTGTQQAATAVDPQDDPGDDHAEDHYEVPQDVLDDLERERLEAEGGALWDDDAIEADINHVVNSRIAKKTRKSYNDYTIRLMIFLPGYR